jgi:hypothetical protein
MSEQLDLVLTPPPPPPDVASWKRLIAIHGADIRSLFLEVAFVPNAEVAELIFQHCWEHHSMAFIERHEKLGLVWNTAYIGTEKKPCDRVHKRPPPAKLDADVARALIKAGHVRAIPGTVKELKAAVMAPR